MSSANYNLFEQAMRLRSTHPVKTAGDARSGFVGGWAASGRSGASNLALWAVRARWIDIEIYDLHATLRLSMAGADAPWSVMELGVADLGQE